MMPGHRIGRACASLAVAAGAGCVNGPSIPPATKAAATCISGVLQSTPGISDVEAYTGYEKSEVILTYRVSLNGGPPVTDAVLVWGAHVGRCSGECDRTAQYRNAFGYAGQRIKAECDADWGYLDQVLFTDGHPRIDLPQGPKPPAG